MGYEEKEKFKSILFLGLMTISILLVGYSQNHYTKQATYYGNGMFIDKQGFEWVYDGDFEVGKQYKLKIFNNSTDSIIADDEVVSVK